MRPGHFYPGDWHKLHGIGEYGRRFNEAGAFLPRRWPLLRCSTAL